MILLGLDLSWSATGRGRTGVCAASTDGTILDSASLQADDEILAWLRRYDQGPLLLAIDAPLIVSNASGSRRCEKQLGTDFGRYEAGAHPANRKRPEFAHGTRGERIASRLDLTLDPVFPPAGSVRAAIEVYPHPATVSLFGLQRTLKYKKKRGRDVDYRRSQFLRFMDFLESSGDLPRLEPRTCPRWGRLREAVSTARSHVVLDTAEDEVDAYMCAYVALYYWTHGMARCRIYGSLTEGYIVTPLPPG